MNFSTVMTMLAVASKTKQVKKVIDIAGAYLNADLKEPEWMRLSKEVAEIYVKVKPELQKCLQKDGTMIVKLKKSLYGLKQAARAWYELLSKTLIELGYTRSKMDRCLFYKMIDGKRTEIAVYVDDLFVAADEEKEIDRLEAALRLSFKEVTVKQGKQISFLGMQINTMDNGDIKINQAAYTRKLVESWGVTKTSPYPYGGNFMDEDVSGETVEATEYLSRCMSLMFLAVKTRPDIALPVSVLAGRVVTRTKGDYDKMFKIAEYLHGTEELGLTFKSDGVLCMNAYVDASFNCHPNARGHSGFAIFADLVGSGAILTKSIKQKTVADSSAEAELIALHELVKNLIWCIAIVEELGFPQRGVVVNEDNTAVIQMTNSEQVNFKGRSKFINRKYFSVHQYVESGELKLVHIGTDLNIADFLTKALLGEKFGRFRIGIMGTAEELAVFGIFLKDWDNFKG